MPGRKSFRRDEGGVGSTDSVRAAGDQEPGLGADHAAQLMPADELLQARANLESHVTVLEAGRRHHA